MSNNSSPYHAAGRLLGEHLATRRGLKSIAFEGGGGKKGKGGSLRRGAPDRAAYATVCKALRCLPAIDAVLDANDGRLRRAVGFDGVRDKGLLYVCLYELLFGKYGRIRGGGKVKRMIVRHEEELRKEAEGYVAKHGSAIGGQEGRSVTFPRYIRVNTLRGSVSDDVVNTLREELSSDTLENKGTGEASFAMYRDAHVPNLLVLPPSAASRLHRDHALVKSGRVVLQDKSSCFSALALARGLAVGKDANEERDGEAFDCIDACAAPGNKTSHLAALVRSSLGRGAAPRRKEKKKKKKKGGGSQPRSTIFAFERSSARFSILEKRMELLVPSDEDGNNDSNSDNNDNSVAVEPVHGDFLKSDPADPKFANVRAIMLDPSCSGSGIVNSPDRWAEEGSNNAKDQKRILSLSNFQLVALKHAMSFPNVDRIVYSTCSVHEEENEAVVSKALSEVAGNGDMEERDTWELAAPTCLDRWERRGKAGGVGGLSKNQAECLVRCDGLDGDETNGFFVAFFIRKRVRRGAKLEGTGGSGEDVEFASLPVYGGQFADDLAKRDTAAMEEGDAAVLPNQIGQPTTDQTQQRMKSKGLPPGKKITDDKLAKSVKKREKKLAWKRKQALQKAQRLKKKEEASKGVSNGNK